MKRKIITVLGTRPELIKTAPLIPLLDARFEHYLVHAGQHYSEKMDSIFFEDLNLRPPDHRLESGALPPAAQAGRIMERLEKYLIEIKPDAVIVQGDTNTTLAGALAAAKHRDMGIRLIHVEALVRSYNYTQAEEINRRIVDSISDYMFAIRHEDLENARKEGISPERVSVFGNTVADACLRMSGQVNDAEILKRFEVEKGEYLFVTCHRQETVDVKESLVEVLRAFRELSRFVPMVFPMHPRTLARIREYGLEFESTGNLRIHEPIGYKDTIGLVKNSRFCLTDSGGLLEEAATMGVPALILRHEVEQVIFVQAGIHELVPPTYAGLMKKVKALLDSPAEVERRRNASFPSFRGVPEKIVGRIAEVLEIKQPAIYA